MPAVRVRNLTKWYPIRRGLGEWMRAPFRRSRLRALHEVGFQVEEGEIVALLGPNGSGKSTVLKILASLVLPTEGSAEVHGFDVTRRSLETRGRIGYCMSEERSFYYRLTGRQNLRFFGRLLGLPPERIERDLEDAAELLRIGEIDDRFMTYSTGTRQKLSVARALLGGRPVLLLDEPTRGLDPYTAGRFLERIRSISRETGRAVLISSHDLGAVDRVADRLAFLHKGELLACGEPEQILGRFDVPIRIDLEVRGPTAEWTERIASLPGVRGVDPPDGREGETHACRVRADREGFRASALLEAVRASCDEILRMEMGRGSLEEVYRRFAEEEDRR
ncbi:MAG: ABC transporter ATP-binding protein [Candidatus Eisenbacteria bacterium]|nr:ABC transporter ATP-binding protein [Candidatus Eisenbacteria bacterium]